MGRGLASMDIDHGDQEWIDHCCTARSRLTATLRAALPFFQIRRSLDEQRDDGAARVSGCQFDLTVEPGIKSKPAMDLEEAHTGALPDYTAAPKWPYRPSRRDFRKRSFLRGRGLWEVPLSTGLRWTGRFASLERAAWTGDGPSQATRNDAPLFCPGWDGFSGDSEQPAWRVEEAVSGARCQNGCGRQCEIQSEHGAESGIPALPSADPSLEFARRARGRVPAGPCKTINVKDGRRKQ